MAEVQVSKEQPPAKGPRSGKFCIQRARQIDLSVRPVFRVGSVRVNARAERGDGPRVSRCHSQHAVGTLDSRSRRSAMQWRNGDLVVTAELPGLKKEDVKVELTDDSLVIRGSASTSRRGTG
jgi:Hsp20/alpha crystallin family